jgi:hypothetical protein
MLEIVKLINFYLLKRTKVAKLECDFLPEYDQMTSRSTKKDVKFKNVKFVSIVSHSIIAAKRKEKKK